MGLGKLSLVRKARSPPWRFADKILCSWWEFFLLFYFLWQRETHPSEENFRLVNNNNKKNKNKSCNDGNNDDIGNNNSNSRFLILGRKIILWTNHGNCMSKKIPHWSPTWHKQLYTIRKQNSSEFVSSENKKVNHQGQKQKQKDWRRDSQVKFFETWNSIRLVFEGSSLLFRSRFSNRKVKVKRRTSSTEKHQL